VDQKNDTDGEDVLIKSEILSFSTLHKDKDSIVVVSGYRQNA